jgi:1-acyl-sn-glycerol-3-phosphate acyltransferase
MKLLRRLLRLAGLYAFQLGFVRPMIRWYWGAHYRRRNNIPEGPCIVVANHNSHIDAVVLMAMFPLRRLPHVHPVAAADYFGKNAFRQGAAMVGMNAMGIERTAAPGRDVLSPMIDALNEGESLIFFPEGSRGEPGVVAQFRPGIGKLVQAVPGLLVLPVFLSGAERSLPRGESVPLPLGIDVIIGKPRSYSPHLDARVIADQVRADVMALAPPPAPVPGPRPAPPLRVACCGIDDEANRALFLAITERLGASGRTVGLGDQVLDADASGVRPSDGLTFARSRAWPKALAWAFRTGGLFRGNKFAEMINRARADEALQDGRSARFVASQGSPLVDLLAWAHADFYSGTFDDKGLQQILLYLSGQRRIPAVQWPRFIGSAPEVWLLNVFDLAHPPAPDVLVLTRRDPASAMELLRSQGRALERWQTEAFLARLQDAYSDVVLVLRRRRVEVVELDAADLDVGSSADAVDAICRRLAVKGVEAPAGG